ncbi:MAG: hypothetical protein ABIZ80_01315 [Bryobacteraceae bacterium]
MARARIETEANSAAIPWPVIGVVAALLSVGGGALYWLDYQSKHATVQGSLLSPEAKGYVQYLALSEVRMQAHESYLKQAVVEIEGKITNSGDRMLQLVEINCVFRDPYGQVVLRERVAIAGRKMGNLTSGNSQKFRLAFDNIPESWNKAMPDLVIATIVFG